MVTSSGPPLPDDGRDGGDRDVAVALQNLLLGAVGVEAFLTEVARSAARSPLHAQSCGLSIRATPRSPMLAATSDEFAAQMDEAQYAVDDGPCLHCLSTGRVVRVEDIAADRRWPVFSRRGELIGAGSSMSVPMRVGEHTVGALNLYSRHVRSLDELDLLRARRFADQTAGAIGLAALLAEREQHLRSALSSRSTIDQAIGVVMGRTGVNAVEAFDVLRRRSQNSNTKLRDVAAGILVEFDPDRAPPGR